MENGFVKVVKEQKMNRKIREILKRPTLAYCTFPLTSDPEANSIKAQRLALKLMEKYPNLCVIIAHSTTQPSESISKYRSIFFDITIISRCDLFIIGKKVPYKDSCGSVWEHQIAKFFGVPIVTAYTLLND